MMMNFIQEITFLYSDRYPQTPTFDLERIGKIIKDKYSCKNIEFIKVR